MACYPCQDQEGIQGLKKFSHSIVLPDPIIDYSKQRSASKEPVHELFKKRELLEIIQGPFKGLTGFFEKLQTFADSLSRATLLVEVLCSV